MDAPRLKRWLGRVRHDLVKPAAWRARDLRDLGRAPDASDRAALVRGLLDLRDGEGAQATALGVWRGLREALAEEVTPTSGEVAALDLFEAAVARAEEMARAIEPSPDGGTRAAAAALALDDAFEQLRQALGAA